MALFLASLPLMPKTSFSEIVLWLTVFRTYVIRKITLSYRKNSLRWEPFHVVLSLFKIVSFKWVS